MLLPIPNSAAALRPTIPPLNKVETTLGHKVSQFPHPLTSQLFSLPPAPLLGLGRGGKHQDKVKTYSGNKTTDIGTINMSMNIQHGGIVCKGATPLVEQ